MEIKAELSQIEEIMASETIPFEKRIVAAGRFFELYVQLPDASQYAEKAESIARVGAESVGPDHSLYPKFRHYQAMAMRYVDPPQAGMLGELGMAAKIDRDAYARSLGKVPADAIVFAADWADWAWDRSLWNEAAEAYANANRAMRAYASGLSDPQEKLKFWQGNWYGSRAAFALSKLGNGSEGILELERASGIHFNRHDTSWMLKHLRDTNPELAARFDACVLASKAFRDSSGAFVVDVAGRISPEAAASQLALNKIVYEIRGLVGFRSFGLPGDWNDIVEAAERGSIVYLVLTTKGLAGFGVKRKDGGQLAVATQTTDITVSDVVKASRPYLEAEFGSLVGDKMETLSTLLDWLSTNVTLLVDRVLSEIGAIGGAIFLQPVGLLSILPLHLERTEDVDKVWGFQPRELTYFYWARGLLHSQQRMEEPATTPSLVINNPQPLPPTLDSLELADFETQVVLSHIAGVELRGNDATLDDVSSELPKASLTHFCCHGTVDQRFLYSGILVLAYPDILMYEHLDDIAEVPARLVVLSACRSGASALEVEHVLSLPALFLSAGAAAVLGTFWHSDEMATLLLMVRFYQLWCDHERSPRTALREAQIWLMSTQASELRKSVPDGALSSPAAAHLKSSRDEDLPYHHPWYWAAFFLAGA